MSRPDPVSQVRQPEAVVFSSVDLTMALAADGHLLPVLESHQPGEPANGFASHLADVADVMHLHPDRRFADVRSASSLSRAELLIRVTPFLLKPCVLSPFGLRLLRGLCRPGHYCL